MAKPEPQNIDEVTARIFVGTQNYLLLQNLSCYDTQGHIFEHYDELYVQKEILRQKETTPNEKKIPTAQTEMVPVRLTCQQAIKQYDEDSFLPSFALTCNLLVLLHEKSKAGDGEADTLLKQYQNLGKGYGWHAQNTLVNYDWNQIIHYPTSEDFERTEEQPILNEPPRVALPFSARSLVDTDINAALDHEELLPFVRNLTGLKDPRQLIEVSKYLGLEARLQFPFRRNAQGLADAQGTFSGIYPAWLGGVTYFHLSTFTVLDFAYAARGVSVNDLPGVLTR